MSSISNLGVAAVAGNAIEGKIALATTLTKIAHNADNAMAGMLDKLVQQGIENSAGSAPQGMGKALDIKV